MFQRRPDEPTADGGCTVVLEEELRDDFVGAALTVRVDPAGIVRHVEFYSSTLGVVRWSPGVGLSAAHAWEDESSAQGTAKSMSAQLGISGKTAGDNIVDYILDNCPSDVAEFVRVQLMHTAQGLVFPKRLLGQGGASRDKGKNKRRK